MYNRYVPQSDGSYRRSSTRDPAAPPVPAQGEQGGLLGLGSFFRQLLPGGLDIEDLLIVLLLLLMSGEKGEEQSYALLTLALYLFL